MSRPGCLCLSLCVFHLHGQPCVQGLALGSDLVGPHLSARLLGLCLQLWITTKRLVDESSFDLNYLIMYVWLWPYFCPQDKNPNTCLIKYHAFLIKVTKLIKQLLCSRHYNTRAHTHTHTQTHTHPFNPYNNSHLTDKETEALWSQILDITTIS